jgi:hypothetical protein
MNPRDFKEMIKMDYFLFAVICVRLTYIFRLFLNLVKDSELDISLKTHKISSCNRR